MVQFLAIFGFVSVVLRGAALCFQTLVIGGIVFAIIVAPRSGAGLETVQQRSRRLIIGSAIALALTQAINAAGNAFLLMQSADLTLHEVLGANFVLAAGVCVVASLIVVAGVARASGWPRHALLLLLAALIIASSVMTSHAESSLTRRSLLGLLTVLHQGATASWIGGLPYLWIFLKHAPDSQMAGSVSRRFSRLAMASVAVLVAAGLGQSLNYIGSWQALYGTTYGTMTAAKVLLLGCLLALGGVNFLILRRPRINEGKSLVTLRTFVEAEIGLGMIVILTAASLTSQPPAVDIVTSRVSSSEIIARLTPDWPRMRTPPLQDLTYFVTARALPGVKQFGPFNSLADKEWSEYNHHWAGLIMLMLGFMAVAASTGRAPWARNWPLLFLALAAFLIFRSDPENWPVGPRSFWATFGDPEVLQHRLAVLLIVAFAIFEWRVRTGRANSNAAALVFPAVCVVGGAVLLTHSHALGNIKESLLVEYNHLPLGILGVVAGWSRWLEIRLPAGDRVRPILSWVWPVCFVLVGALLLHYREI